MHKILHDSSSISVPLLRQKAQAQTTATTTM